jgi:hypothetical protein
MTSVVKKRLVGIQLARAVLVKNKCKIDSFVVNLAVFVFLFSHNSFCTNIIIIIPLDDDEEVDDDNDDDDDDDDILPRSRSRASKRLMATADVLLERPLPDNEREESLLLLRGD